MPTLTRLSWTKSEKLKTIRRLLFFSQVVTQTGNSDRSLIATVACAIELRNMSDVVILVCASYQHSLCLMIVGWDFCFFLSSFL